MKRSAAQIREHYEIEKELAAKLRSAPKSQRGTLYRELYDELFRRVPHHPQLIARESIARRRVTALRQVEFLRSLCDDPPVFLELGAGDCMISLAFSDQAKQVFSVDVSDEITHQVRPPPNFRLILSDGCNIDVAENSVDLAFSNQLMEHLHVEDALEQLRNVYAVLRPGGKYFCVTPNRMSGPHDVSQHFDREACGFHLHEYRIRELIGLCRKAGFTKFYTYIGKDGRYLRVPIWLVELTERFVALLPGKSGKFAPLRLLLGIRLLSEKPRDHLVTTG